MIQTSINAFLVVSGLLVVTTVIIFVVFAIGNMSDKYRKRITHYWNAVIGATLEYLSVAVVFWGIATAICLLLFTIGLGFLLAGTVI